MIPSRSAPPGRKQSVERSRQRADVVGSGFGDIADNVDSNRAQAGERHIYGDFVELGTQHALNGELDFPKTLATHQHRPGLGQSDAPSPVDHTNESLRHSAP